jgi:hypothetical protein
MRRIAGFLFYLPRKTECCAYCYRMPYTPPLYTYFLTPPCIEGCGVTACGPGGCDGYVSKCGFCTPGHRMFGLFTGHGFGFCGRCGGCGTCR